MKISNQKYASALLAVFIVIGCTPRGLRHESTETSPVISFLDHLKSDTRPMRTYTFMEEKECWVQESDIPELVRRMHSEERAMSVVMSIASSVRTGSTEGDEAVFLIEGFRKGKYPPSLASTAANEQKKNEIERWWAAYRSGSAAKSPEILHCQRQKGVRVSHP